MLARVEGLVWRPAGRAMPVLGPLDLSLGREPTVAVIGPNGAGKTTLLRLLAGLLAPTAGQVRWRDRPLSGLDRRRVARAIAYLPQVRPLDVPFTVEEVVLLGRYPYFATWQSAPAAADFAALERALDRTGVAGLRNRPLAALSGGERQLAYLAGALAQDPELLLLDEPTTHLDPHHQARLAAILSDVVAGPGPGAGSAPVVVFTTHDVAFANLASRVVALRQGVALADGSPSDILRPEVLGGLYDVAFDWPGATPTAAVPQVRLERGP